MKVLNAVQVFSNTVAVALNLYADQGLLPKEEAEPLAELIKIINDLFDIFNSVDGHETPTKAIFTGILKVIFGSENL